MQRDRDFDHYQDLETRTDLRPSVWVVPQGDWGNGHVELVEIPTKTDTNDNIVAFWVPEKPPKVDDPITFAYTLYWYGDDPARPPGGRVVATRRDRGNQEDTVPLRRRLRRQEARRRFPADQVLRGVVSVASEADAAELLDQHVVKNPVTGGWRLTFQVKAEAQGAGGAARLPRQGRRHADGDVVVRAAAMSGETPMNGKFQPSSAAAAAEPPAPHFAVPPERLLQDWRAAHARAVVYLEALGIPENEREPLARVAVERALQREVWPAGSDAVGETLRALRALLPERCPGAAGAWQAAADAFLAWRLDAYLTGRFAAAPRRHAVSGRLHRRCRRWPAAP